MLCYFPLLLCVVATIEQACDRIMECIGVDGPKTFCLLAVPQMADFGLGSELSLLMQKHRNTLKEVKSAMTMNEEVAVSLEEQGMTDQVC